MPRPDVYVIGAGLFGLTFAERAAGRWGKHVQVLERRSHVGGNALSEVDSATGIEVHRYGAHIFHTSNERVWRYVTGFTDFFPYEHRAFTRHRGVTYPLPINLQTINQFFGMSLSPEQARKLIENQAASSRTGSAGNLRDRAIAEIGEPLYEAFIEGYTAKKWQMDPKRLPASTISRLPVRLTFDSRYFNDVHQGLPASDYASWLQRIASHPFIDISLGTDFFRSSLRTHIADRSLNVPVVYTGPLDKYFDFELGQLGWRTLDFEFQRVAQPDFQGTAVMNEADIDVPYTRTIEFRHFRPDHEVPVAESIIDREFSRSAEQGDEPYYPINSADDRDRLSGYRARAESLQDVYFGGRLGTCKYLDMHMAIASALTLVERIANDRSWVAVANEEAGV